MPRCTCDCGPSHARYGALGYYMEWAAACENEWFIAQLRGGCRGDVRASGLVDVCVVRQDCLVLSMSFGRLECAFVMRFSNLLENFLILLNKE